MTLRRGDVVPVTTEYAAAVVTKHQSSFRSTFASPW